jgi:L-amino acid N-acyltransferase YncA
MSERGSRASHGRSPAAETVRIRPARALDSAAIGRVYVDSWRTSYAGLLPDDYLARLSYLEQESAWRLQLARPGLATFVAEDATGQIVGFASGGAERTGTGTYFAELYTLYLLEDYHGRGIGRQLVSAFCGRIMRVGFRSMLVWVLQGNPARRFYARLGGQMLQTRPVRAGGTTLMEVAYGWRDVAALSRDRPRR